MNPVLAHVRADLADTMTPIGLHPPGDAKGSEHERSKSPVT
jgi:hypothetical protein